MTILTKLVIAVAVGCKYSSCGQLKNVNTRKKVVEGLRHNCFHGAWTSESCLKNRGLIDPSIMDFFLASECIVWLFIWILSEDCFLVFRADG